MERDGQVAGQGPDGRGPNDEEQLVLVIGPQLPLIIVHGELHIYGGNGIVLILDLRLRQSGLIVRAPVNRLEALVNDPLLIHSPENLDLLGLEAWVHGQIGMLPVADDAHALEALPLHVHIVLGELVAGGAELRHAHLLPVELVLLDDGGFNGHPVVVPAGDIGRIVPPHGGGAHHKVLDGLVEGVSHMEGAVGEGRAVMEGIAGLPLVFLKELMIEVHFLPALQHSGFPCRQSRPHGKLCLRQVDGLVIIHLPVFLLCE